MRKITLLLVIMTVFWTANIYSETVKTYFVNQDFTGVAAHPAGWSSGTDANFSLFGSGAFNYNTPSDRLNLTGGGTGNRGIKVTFPTSGSESLVYLDFDWIITGATVGRLNALGLYLQDNVAASFTTTGDVLILYCSGTDGKIHCQNIDNMNAVFQNNSASGSFLKAGTSDALCNSANSSTITTCSWAAGNIINIKATLNFSTHVITYLKISNTTTGLTSYENTAGLNFISNTASNLSKICLTNTRTNSTGTNGSNTALNVGIDNFQTYKTTDLGTLSSNSPQCTGTGVTLTCSGTAPSGQTYYWQTSASGTSTTYPTTSTYTVTTSGNYYVRSLTTTGSVWSDASSPVAVTVYPLSVGGTATAVDATVPVNSHTNINLTGNTGSNIQWYVSTNGTDYSVVSGGSGATTATYTTPDLSTGTYYYKALVQSGSCSSEYSTVTTVEAVNSSAVVNINTTSLSTYGKVANGSTSSSKNFTVSGTGLAGNITITPPTGYQLSTDDSNFSTSNIVLTRLGDNSVATTTIFVRFAPAAIQTYSYSGVNGISIVSTNVSTQYIDLTGIGIAAEPTTQASSAIASNVLQTSMTLGWTKGSGSKSIVLYSTNSDVATANIPIDGTTYTTGTEIASGYNIAYIGTGNSVALSSLTANTTYYFAVFSFEDGGSGSENYKTDSPSTLTQVTPPNSNATDYFRTKVTTGRWDALSSWESSSDGNTWYPATLIPQSNSISTLVKSNVNPLTIGSDILPTNISTESGASLKISKVFTGNSYTFAPTITGTGSLSIQLDTVPNSKPSIYTINPTFSGITTVNYILNPLLDVTGIRVVGGGSAYNVGFGGSTKAPLNTQFNVSSIKGGQTFPLANDLYLQDSKLYLGDNVTVARVNSQTGLVSMYIGELSSSTTPSANPPKLISGFSTNTSRIVSYYIGSLNTDATYSGQFAMYSSTGYAPIDIHKEGTGTWTLTGVANANHSGSFFVDNGKVILNGSLGSANLTTTVASGKILEGTGTLNGSATVNGTLQGTLTISGATTISSSGTLTGSLNFGSTLTLAGTTNLTVTDFTSAYDVIDVTGAVTNGGTLNITVNAAAPANGTSIKLINAGSYSSSFSTVNIPAGYSFNAATGYLKYGTDVSVTTNTDITALTLPSNPALTVNTGNILTLNQNTTLSSLTVAPGAKVSLQATKSFSASSVTLQSSVSGTATFVDADATGTAIAATVQQYLPTGRNWYVSIPVANVGETITASALTSAGATSVSYWNESAGAWENNYSGPLTPGKGYIAVSNAGSATNNASFSGNLNTGNFPVTVTRTVTAASKPGFNLIANPYPSYLNPCALITGKTKLEPTIWYRTAVWNGTKYVYSFQTVTTADGIGTGGVTGYIPPMQAFWVRVLPNADPLLNNSETLTFTNDMRYHGNPTVGETTITTTALKAPQQTSSKKIIRLQVSNGIIADEAILYTNPNASNSYDRFDSHKMTNDNVAIPELYTVIGSENLVINGFNQLPENVEIPLGFKTGEPNSFTIKANQISNLDQGTTLVLKDKLMDTEQELTEGDVVTFSSDAVNTTSRFSLILKANSTVTETELVTEMNTDWSVYVNKNAQLVVSGVKPGSLVLVYNAIGQKITERKIQTQQEVLQDNYSTGIYMVTVNHLVKKVVVK